MKKYIYLRKSSFTVSNRYDASSYAPVIIKQKWCIYEQYVFFQRIPVERLHSPFAFCFRGGAWHPDFSWLNCRRSRRTREDRVQQSVAQNPGRSSSGRDHKRQLQGRRGRGRRRRRRILWSASFGSVILQTGFTARRSLKMNSLVLMSLFATVIAGKSPRLKFVVHGRQCCVFWMLSGFTIQTIRQLFMSPKHVLFINSMCKVVD